MGSVSGKTYFVTLAPFCVGLTAKSKIGRAASEEMARPAARPPRLGGNLLGLVDALRYHGLGNYFEVVTAGYDPVSDAFAGPIMTIIEANDDSVEA